MNLIYKNSHHDVINKEYYDFIIKTTLNDDLYTNIVQCDNECCCYGRLTNSDFKYHRILSLDLNIFIPKPKKSINMIIASSWFRSDKEFYDRISHMQDLLKIYKINYTLDIENHEDTKRFVYYGDCEYFQLNFKFEKTEMYVVFFVLDMIRRCFNTHYDVYWTFIEQLSKEFPQLNEIYLWILSDVLNFGQPSDANLSQLCYNSTFEITEKTFKALTNYSNIATLYDNVTHGKKWNEKCSYETKDCVPSDFKIDLEFEQRRCSFDNIKENFHKLIENYVKEIEF